MPFFRPFCQPFYKCLGSQVKRYKPCLQLSLNMALEASDWHRVREIWLRVKAMDREWRRERFTRAKGSPSLGEVGKELHLTDVERPNGTALEAVKKADRLSRGTWQRS
jgi:hypothetical protein